MAYRSDFEFPALTPGQFFYKVFETGKVMVGWGRTRSKFVQLDQAEITAFLEHAHEMVRTDDQALKDLLGQVAKAITAGQPRWATLADLTGASGSGDATAKKATERMFALISQENASIEEAFAKVNAEFAEL